MPLYEVTIQSDAGYSEMGKDVTDLIAWYVKDGLTAMRTFFKTNHMADAQRADYAFGRAQYLSGMYKERGLDWMHYWLF